jgi:UDP-N-acetylmuramate--alanine ligase
MPTPNTHEGAQRINAYLQACTEEKRSVFFIGVGGVMMSSLALLTRRAGHSTAGSDRTRTAVTEALEADGVSVFYHHAAENLSENCGLVVYTVAIAPDNPEYVAARERGIPCVSRADYLGALMTGFRRRVGVAGMHGKSTCTSICAQILLDADVDPTILSGASYAPMGGAYRLGDSKEHFLFEACEYMDSFLDFNPTVAILLGAELEHVDYFKSMEQIIGSFARFASLTGEDGVTVVNADDKHILESARRALESGSTGRLITFSAAGKESADLYARHIQTVDGFPRFELIAHGECKGTVSLAVPGRFQVINALAAAAAMEACDIPWEAILSGLSRYIGAGRRMERKGEINGAAVYDDYGHHPTEIKATLEGAKSLCTAKKSDGHLICVFQPHTYSRTANLYPRFLSAFDAADRVLLLDIYAAREINTYGVSSEGLTADINAASPDKARYCASPVEAAAAIRELAREGDSVVIMGAGDVIRVTEILLARTED